MQILKPDLLFLDIEMPRLNGFQLLERLGDVPFHLIFVTAYNELAVKAFCFSALDYLLKPIDGAELREAVRKAERRPGVGQVEALRTQLQTGQLADKIAVPYQNGVLFLPVAEVVYCEADSNYTRVMATQGRQFLLTRTPREVQEVLETRDFLRVHRQYLVNLDHLQRYVRGEGTYLVMTDGTSIPVARNQKERLVQRFGWI